MTGPGMGQNDRMTQAPRAAKGAVPGGPGHCSAWPGWSCWPQAAHGRYSRVPAPRMAVVGLPLDTPRLRPRLPARGAGDTGADPRRRLPSVPRLGTVPGLLNQAEVRGTTGVALGTSARPGGCSTVVWVRTGTDRLVG